jgi:polyhydroxybutyrate depolymerase
MRKSGLFLIVLAIAVLLLAGVFSRARGRRAPADDRELHIQAGGADRSYFLHVPEGLASGKPAPLVLVFHGGGGHAATMPRFTRFDELADREEFLVAYPESANIHWNDSRGRSPADDAGFVRALIAELERDLADKLGAAASVAATMPEPLVAVCKPSAPIS